MTDLIDRLTARAAGLERGLTPRVGSLFEPSEALGWGQAGIEEILQEVTTVGGQTRRSWARGVTLAGAGSVSIPRGTAAPGKENAATGWSPSLSREPGPDVEAVPSPTSPAAAPSRANQALAESRLESSATQPAALQRELTPPIPLTIPARPAVAPAAEAGGNPSGPAASRLDAGQGSVPRSRPAAPAMSVPRRVHVTSRSREQEPATAAARGSDASSRNAAPAASRPMRAADRIATDLEAVDETIVNVTIGRIELKAVTQPEQAAAPRPFPSLQEYLRRAGDGGT